MKTYKIKLLEQHDCNCEYCDTEWDEEVVTFVMADTEQEAVRKSRKRHPDSNTLNVKMVAGEGYMLAYANGRPVFVNDTHVSNGFWILPREMILHDSEEREADLWSVINQSGERQRLGFVSKDEEAKRVHLETKSGNVARVGIDLYEFAKDRFEFWFTELGKPVILMRDGVADGAVMPMNVSPVRQKR